MKILRALVLWIGVIGSLVFAGAFAASFTSDHFISETARAVIHYRVAQEINEKVEAIGGDFLLNKATELLGRNKEGIDAVKAKLKAGITEQVARVVQEMRDPNCVCRTWIPQAVREGLMNRIGDLNQLQDRLVGMIRAKYLEVEAKLTREYRIFTGTNAIICFILVGAALLKRRNGARLVPAAAVLLLASVITGYAYLFNQNWLMTILYGDYVGYAYIAYVVLVFFLLADFLLNRGRITAHVLDGIFGNLTSVFSSIDGC